MITLRRAADRGRFDFGWLDTWVDLAARGDAEVLLFDLG